MTDVAVEAAAAATEPAPGNGSVEGTPAALPNARTGPENRMNYVKVNNRNRSTYYKS